MLYASHLKLADYKTLLKNCELILGNSSSGIHEAATFKKPAVNIDPDNKADLKEKNIIDVSNNCKDIQKGVKKALQITLTKKLKYKNPYGSGGSSKKICKLLRT